MALETKVGVNNSAVTTTLDYKVSQISVLVAAACVSTANVSLSGFQTIDGYTLVAGDRALLTAQTTASQNGPWLAASGAWTRPPDFVSGAVVASRTILVVNGTANANTQWALDAPTAGITVDTSSQTWAKAGGASAVSSVFGRTGAVVATSGDYSVGQVTGAAPLASPALTGTPTGPTASAGTNTTQLATTAFVETAVATGVVTTQAGTSYTFALTDAFTTVESTNTAATVFTIPTNASVGFAVGTTIVALQGNTGSLTITGATGVTVNGVSAGSHGIIETYRTIVIQQVAANTWVAISSKQYDSIENVGVMPTGMSAETFPRRLGAGTATTLASGVLHLDNIGLPYGMNIGHIAYQNASTALGTPTHWWFALFDQNLNMLAVTADQLTNAWAAYTWMSLPIATTAAGASTSFRTTYSGRYYLGIVAVATTMTNIFGYGGNGLLTYTLPATAGTSSSGLTSPPAFPYTASAITANSTILYGAVGS